MTHFFRSVLTYINKKAQSDDSCHLYSSIVPSIHFVPFNVSNSKRNWAKFGVGVKLIVILRHIIAYFSINIRWHSQNVSSDSRKWLIKHLFPPSSCKKQINKQNSYLLLALLQSGSVPELDMHESKHFLPGPFVHSDITPIMFVFLSWSDTLYFSPPRLIKVKSAWFKQCFWIQFVNHCLLKI